jgi:hypothetical protein
MDQSVSHCSACTCGSRGNWPKEHRLRGSSSSYPTCIALA